jgi:hypothetical protein
MAFKSMFFIASFEVDSQPDGSVIRARKKPLHKSGLPSSQV